MILAEVGRALIDCCTDSHKLHRSPQLHGTLAMQTNPSTHPHTPSFRWFQHCALIICPNLELCEQVVATAATLTASPPTDAISPAQPLLHARVVAARSPPPQRAPTDIVVSTPAALLRLLEEAGGAYGPEWVPENFAQRVRHVVIDEADAQLTSDSFYRPLSRILDVQSPMRPPAHILLIGTTALRPFDFPAMSCGLRVPGQWLADG